VDRTVVVGSEVFAVANPAPRVGGPVWLFVRLDTDSGISGYGEIFTSALFTRPLTTARLVAEFIDDFVVGRRAVDRELIYLSSYNSHYSRAGDMLKTAVMSGVDIALWDIAGKSAGLAVCDLLGGRMRDSVRMYTYLGPPDDAADGPPGREFWSDPAAVGARARDLVGQGFTGLKVDPMPLLTGLDHQAGEYVPVEPSLRALDHAESVVAAIRGAVGSGADIMIGTHGQFTAAGAVRYARQLEPYRPLWFEEPVPPERPEEMAQVARATAVPVAAGERLTSKWQFAALARAGAAAIFNFDVTQVGGLTEGKKIAALAEAGFLQVTPHVYGGPLAAAASCQLALSLPNLLIMEGNGTYGGPYAELLDNPLDWSGGYLNPPARPGIGHDLDERVARQWAVTADDAFAYARHARLP
jgi:L-alanine-DL-glutamate epimerase-like enolase superfamily enzyme